MQAKNSKNKCFNLRKQGNGHLILSITLFEESLLGLEVFSFLIFGGGVEKMSESADRFRAINCLKWRTVDSGKLKYLNIYHLTLLRLNSTFDLSTLFYVNL